MSSSCMCCMVWCMKEVFTYTKFVLFIITKSSLVKESSFRLEECVVYKQTIISKFKNMNWSKWVNRNKCNMEKWDSCSNSRGEVVWKFNIDREVIRITSSWVHFSGTAESDVIVCWNRICVLWKKSQSDTSFVSGNKIPIELIVLITLLISPTQTLSKLTGIALVMSSILHVQISYWQNVWLRCMSCTICSTWVNTLYMFCSTWVPKLHFTSF